MKKSKTFDLIQVSERQAAFDMIFSLYGKQIEISEVIKTRSNSQNNALHKYFALIAEQFNELGISYKFTNIIGYTVDIPWNLLLVKDFIWRPIQRTLFDIDSTTEINTKQINEIIVILDKHFAELGFEIDFPCWQTFLNSQDAKK